MFCFVRQSLAVAKSIGGKRALGSESAAENLLSLAWSAVCSVDQGQVRFRMSPQGISFNSTQDLPVVGVE